MLPVVDFLVILVWHVQPDRGVALHAGMLAELLLLVTVDRMELDRAKLAVIAVVEGQCGAAEVGGELLAVAAPAMARGPSETLAHG